MNDLPALKTSQNRSIPACALLCCCVHVPQVLHVALSSLFQTASQRPPTAGTTVKFLKSTSKLDAYSIEANADYTRIISKFAC